MSADAKAGPAVTRARLPLVACALNAFAVEPTPGEPPLPV